MSGFRAHIGEGVAGLPVGQPGDPAPIVLAYSKPETGAWRTGAVGFGIDSEAVLAEVMLQRLSGWSVRSPDAYTEAPKENVDNNAADGAISDVERSRDTGAFELFFEKSDTSTPRGVTPFRKPGRLVLVFEKPGTDWQQICTVHVYLSDAGSFDETVRGFSRGRGIFPRYLFARR